jgi:hypothetical protein
MEWQMSILMAGSRIDALIPAFFSSMMNTSVKKRLISKNLSIMSYACDLPAGVKLTWW